MKSLTPETAGGKAEAIEGTVILDGPDGVAVSMTAEAARETSRQLKAAADDADRQTTDET